MSQRRTQGTKSTASTSPRSTRRLRLNAAIPKRRTCGTSPRPTSRDTSRSPSWVPIGKPWRLSSWGVIFSPGRHSSSAPRTRMLSRRRGPARIGGQRPQRRLQLAEGKALGQKLARDGASHGHDNHTGPLEAPVGQAQRERAPSARGGSTAATSHSTRSSTPAAAQAALRQSSTDAALLAKGYSRPSPSSRHISP